MATAPDAPRVTPLFSDDVLGRLRRVILSSRNLSKSGLIGEHRSSRKGPSPAFADYRNYTVGDDFRRIDWRAYARLDTLYVRESEITSEFDVHLLVDVSRSMDWSGSPERPTKLRRALQIAGALGYLSLWSFDRVSITPIGSNAAYRFGPFQGRSRIRSMLAYLERLHASNEADLVSACNRLIHERRKPGFLVVLSDFLSEDSEGLEASLRSAIGRGWEAVLIQVVDPAEEDPALMAIEEPMNQAEDLEAGSRLPIRFDAASISDYQARRQAWQDALSRLDDGVNTRFVVMSTGDPVDGSFAHVLRSIGLVS